MEEYRNMTETTPELEPAHRALELLSPANRQLVLTMLGSLAEREGISMGPSTSGLAAPADGLHLWEAKQKQEGYSSRTTDTYLSSLRRVLAAYPTPSRLDIQQWLAERLDQVSTSAVSTDRKALRSFFSFLHEEGLWPYDPTVRLRSVKVSYRAKDPPSADEVRTLMSYQCRKAEDTERFQLMTLLLATTALRITEAASLRKDRIFTQTHEIRVVGKGNKERVVPLVPITEAALVDYLERNTEPSPYVFPGDTHTGWWAISSYEKTLKRACKALGLKAYTPHYLRHFYATYLLQQGAKLEVVSHILGHASIGTTGDIYRHVLTTEMHEASRQFAPLQDVPRLGPAAADVVEGEFIELEGEDEDAGS
jgi:integrase/recombinase XerD